MRPRGIVIISSYAPYLGYGWKHGFGCGWLPDWIQRLVVGSWNRAVCFVRGHVPLDLRPEENYYIACLMCGVGGPSGS